MEYWWTYADLRNWSMKSTVPPVRMPPALPVGWAMPLGNGFTMLQPAHGVRPPLLVATISVRWVKPRVPRLVAPMPGY